MPNEFDHATPDLDHLSMQIDGYHVTAVIYAAIKTGVLDRLEFGRQRAELLATDLGVSSPHMTRLLRAAAAVGLCEEQPAGFFSLSANGHALRSGSPSPLREKAILAVEQYWLSWADIAFSIETGQTAFEHAHGMPPWQWRRENSIAGALFDDWLGKETRAIAPAIAASLDLADAHSVADIGGGVGALLAAILTLHPTLTGVLFEQSEVIDKALQWPLESAVFSRVETVAGDFFDHIPVAAEVFVLKSVLHDWGDDQVTSILRNCRSAMDPNSRLIVIERVLPEGCISDVVTTMLDIHMMAVTGGKERSMAEIIGLLNGAGFGQPTTIGSVEGFALIEVQPN
jgi:hypothetical protein